MESECRCRFVLLDFGHPMNISSIYNIIKSLENILALGLSFSRREKTFGISVLNSDFAIFESESNLRRNYGLVIENLKALLKTTKYNSRVTVQEYKHLLSNSIEGVLCDSQKLKRSNKLCSQSTPLIQIAILTKKTASLLADILTDVTNKLQRNFPNMPHVKNYKIVQILNKQDNSFGASDRNMLIHWTSCLDNIYDLNCFFKEWLLNQQQQLQILLSKELNLEVECDVDNGVVNPVSVTGRFDLYSDFQCTSQPPRGLEIINRLPVNCFRPIFAFGSPRRISPTGSWEPSIESQVRSKLFKQLCQELYQTEQGLLAKSVLSTEREELNTFHLLTSDGNILLMCDVAPEELYLPPSVTFSSSIDSGGDEDAASVIRTCLEKIKPLSEYKPKYFSSGVYDYLRDCLIRDGDKKSLFGRFDPSVKLFGKRDPSRTTPGDAAACENRKKRPKPGPETEVENVHPALLSPNIVEKYRKIHSQAFNLPELRM